MLRSIIDDLHQMIYACTALCHKMLHPALRML